MDDKERTKAQKPDITAPPGGKTHEASAPAGKGDVDQEAIDRGTERLEQASGSH
jgi:hypothetical protein